MRCSLEPVISTAQTSFEACGHVIGDQHRDDHIHHPRGHARYGTGMTYILDDCGPDRPLPLRDSDGLIMFGALRVEPWRLCRGCDAPGR